MSGIHLQEELLPAIGSEDVNDVVQLDVGQLLSCIGFRCFLRREGLEGLFVSVLFES